MKADVNTFGGAVSHLEKTFQTLNFLNNKEQITKYVEDNPNDVETKTAWNTYAEVMRNIKRQTHEARKCLRPRQNPRFWWTAEDLKTGEKFTTTSAVALGFKISANRNTVNKYCKRGKLWKNRYKITRTRV